MPQLIEQLERDSNGQVRQRYQLQNGRLEGVALTYDERGWLLRSASYYDGLLDGDELLYGNPGGALFAMSSDLQGDLDRLKLSEEVRQAFADNQIALFDDALVTIVEPGQEYLIAQNGQSYTVRDMGTMLNVHLGRLIQKTHFQEHWIVSRARYQGGHLEGETASYGPIGAPLFALDLAFQPDFDTGNLKPLQPAFRLYHQPLSDEAVVAVEQENAEWRIMQPNQMFTIRRAGNQLTVHPGRITRRQIFGNGWLVEDIHYQLGLRDGELAQYGPIGKLLFALGLAARDDLNNARIDALAPLFLQQGFALSGTAAVASVVADIEWFIAQAGQSYTVTRIADHLGVFPGRAINRAGYKSGQLDGTTILYDNGAAAQAVSFKGSLLDGPLILYAGGLEQTVIDFKAGKKNGNLIAYDERGQQMSVSHYQDDLLDGQMELYKDGKRRAITTYSNGKQNGPATAFHDNGRVSMASNYKDSLLDGETMLYDEDGQLIKKAPYQAGKLQGDVIEYFPSGAVRKRSHYQDDKLEGTVYTYDDKGNLMEKRHYRNGEQVGKPEKPSWLPSLVQR